MNKKFFKNFDKKRFALVSEIIITLFAVVCIVNIVGRTYTRYESVVDISADANIAFFIVDQGTYEGTISLTGLTPSLDPLYYTFYVSNTKDGKRANVDMTYTIKFETTTNLPLSYEVVRNEDFEGSYTNLLSSLETRQDEDDVYYRVYSNNQTYTFSHNRDELDEYTLKVIFPDGASITPFFVCAPKEPCHALISSYPLPKRVPLLMVTSPEFSLMAVPFTYFVAEPV